MGDNTVSHHHLQGLPSRGQKEHRTGSGCVISRVATLIYFSVSYILKVLSQLTKNKQRNTFFFPGLGYHLWFIFHCFGKTCSTRFSHCSAPPWAGQYIPQEAAQALSLSHQEQGGSDYASKISNGYSSSDNHNNHNHNSNNNNKVIYWGLCARHCANLSVVVISFDSHNSKNPHNSTRLRLQSLVA